MKTEEEYEADAEDFMLEQGLEEYRENRDKRNYVKGLVKEVKK